MKIMKRVLVLLLTLALCIGCLPVAVIAAEMGDSAPQETAE